LRVIVDVNFNVVPCRHGYERAVASFRRRKGGVIAKDKKPAGKILASLGETFLKIRSAPHQDG
jgi:hypothetical protein